MPKTKLSAARVWVVACSAIVLGACSSTPTDPTANWSAKQLYANAKEELAAGSFERAAPLFDKLESRAAGTPLAQQAQLEKAYAQYKNGESMPAIATLERFMRLHPASPALDYALYLKGLVNFNDDLGLFSSFSKQDLAERDQRAAMLSFGAFKELVTRFPESQYTPDAKARMRYIVNSLARSEVYVARYYYQRGAYLAAANRAQAAVANYQDAPALEEALSLMVQCYDALGLAQLRDDAQRVLEKSYPQSSWLRQSGKTSQHKPS